mgnify:CR=1 FL=1
MTLRLHCFGESGNAYKVALMLSLSGADWEPVFVDFFNGATRGPAFRALNPMGEVPVLEDGDRILSQSGAILDHLAGRTGAFAAASEEERTEILRWLLWDSQKMSGQAGAARFLENFLSPEKRPAAVIDWLRGRLRTALQVLDGVLGSRDWLVGGRPTIADLACCGYLYYPEPFGFDRAAWANIDAWLGRIAALDGWAHPYDLMPRGFPPGDAARGGTR